MRLSQLFIELRLAGENYNNGLRKAQMEMKEFQKSVAPTNKLLRDVEVQATAAGKALTVAVTAPLVAIGALGVKFNAMEQTAHVAFTRMLGDADKATAKLNELKDFAAKTPFEFPDLIRAAQRMKGMGFASEEVLPLLTAVGDAVAGMGGGAAEIDRVTLALGQMIGRGRIATQEMNQLTEHGIPAWKILADAMGKTEEQLRSMVEKGAVPARQAVADLVAGMNKQFGGMMAEQAKTFTGLFSTIRDEARFLAGELTEGLFNQLQGPMQMIADEAHNLRVQMDHMDASTKAWIASSAIAAAAAGPLLYVIGALAGAIINLLTLGAKLGPVWTSLTKLLEGIGLVSIPAAAGITLVGAAIGIATGSIINFLMQGTKLEAWLDSISKDFLVAWASEGQLLETTTKMAAHLKDKYGPAIERGTMNIQQWHDAVLKQLRVEMALDPVLQAQIKANRELAADHLKMLPILEQTLKIRAAMTQEAEAARLAEIRRAEAALEAAKAFEEFRKGVTRLKESVTINRNELAMLDTAIKELIQSGVPASLVIAQMGKAALDAAKTLRALGEAVPQGIEFAAFGQFQVMIEEAMARSRESLQKGLDDWREDWNKTLDGMNQDLKTKLILGDALLLPEFKKMTLIIDVKPPEDPEWVDLQKRGQELIDDFADGMSKMFVDSIAHGKSFWEAFKNFGVNAIATIADMFITSVIKNVLDQFKEQFGKWQKEFTDWLSKLKAGDILKFAAPIGIGAAVGGAVGGQVGAAAGGLAGTALSLAVNSHPVAAALAGVAAIGTALVGMIGRGRRMADEFVRATQGPMTEATTDLFNALDSARQMGTLTTAQVATASIEFEKMWESFQEAAAEAGIVGQQGLATMTPFVESWRDWLDSLDDAARQIEHMNAVYAKAGQVTMAAQGFDILEEAIAAMLATGQSTAHIVHFLGSEISDMAEKMRILGIQIPPATQSILELIEAAEAMERLKDIDDELSDIFGSIADTLQSKLDGIAAGVESSENNIASWSEELEDANQQLLDQSDLLQDAAHWQKVYDGVVRDSAQEMKRLADERKDTEERMVSLEEQIQRDMLTDAVERAKKTAGITETLIETITTGLTKAGHAFTTISKTRQLSGSVGGPDLAAAESALAAFEATVTARQRQARLQELNELRTRLPEIIQQQTEAAAAYAKAIVAGKEAVELQKEELREKMALAEERRKELKVLIPLEYERLAMLEKEREATIALMDALGIARQSEFEAVNQTIEGLIDRADELVKERDILLQLPGVTASASAAISAFIANLRSIAQSQAQQQAAFAIQVAMSAASMATGSPRPMPLPSYDSGVAHVPMDQIAMVHKGERILTAKDNADLIPVLQEILMAIRNGQHLTAYLDGQKVSSVLSDSVQHGSITLVASRVKR